MSELTETSAVSYEEAVFTVLKGINMRVDPRKALWCNYPALNLERDELGDKVSKDTRSLAKETGIDLFPEGLWYCGVPRFKLIRLGVAHLNCVIDLYYVACCVTDEDHPCRWCWYGKIIARADTFDFPQWALQC